MWAINGLHGHSLRRLVDDCPYPYVDTSRGCTTLFSDVLGSRYTLIRLLLLSIGGFLTAVCLLKLVMMAKRAEGTRPQWIIFPFLMSASVCLCLQGIDPLGLAGELDLVVYMLANAFGTCSICSAAFFLVALGAVSYRGAVPPSRSVNVLTSPFIIMGTLGVIWLVIFLTSVFYSMDLRSGHQFTVRLLESAALTLLGAIVSAYCFYIGCTMPSTGEIQLRPSSSAVLAPASKRVSRSSNHEEKLKSSGWTQRLWSWWQAKVRTSKLMLSLGLIVLALTALVVAYLITLLTEGKYQSSWESYEECLATQSFNPDLCHGSVDIALMLAVEAVLILAFIVSFWVDRSFESDDLLEKLHANRSPELGRAESTGWFTSSSEGADSEDEGEILEASPAVSSEIFSSRGSYDYDGKNFDDLMPPDDGEEGTKEYGSAKPGPYIDSRHLPPSLHHLTLFSLLYFLPLSRSIIYKR